jgi:hypothetical protein
MKLRVLRTRYAGVMCCVSRLRADSLTRNLRGD